MAVMADLDEVKIFNFVKAFTEILIEEVSSGNDVTIDDFGDFEVKKQSEYILLDTESGERKLMPPSVVLDFKPVDGSVGFTLDESLEKELNSAFNNFEPTLLNEGVELEGVEVVVVGQDVEDELIDDEPEDIVEEESNEVYVSEEAEKSEIDLDESEEVAEEVLQDDVIYDENEPAGEAVEDGVDESEVENDEEEVVAEEDVEVKNVIYNEGETYSEEREEEVYESETKTEASEDEIIIDDTPKDLNAENNEAEEDLYNREEQLIHRNEDVGKKRNNTKSKIIIPIIGGVAIALASLFFFKRDGE